MLRLPKYNDLWGSRFFCAQSFDHSSPHRPLFGLGGCITALWAYQMQHMLIEIEALFALPQSTIHNGTWHYGCPNGAPYH
jgi:hypothetical protein